MCSSRVKFKQHSEDSTKAKRERAFAINVFHREPEKNNWKSRKILLQTRSVPCRLCLPGIRKWIETNLKESCRILEDYFRLSECFSWQLTDPALFSGISSLFLFGRIAWYFSGSNVSSKCPLNKSLFGWFDVLIIIKNWGGNAYFEKNLFAFVPVFSKLIIFLINVWWQTKHFSTLRLIIRCAFQSSK